MTISVTGPDGSTFNFPDETSQEIIKGALSKHYGASKPKQEPVGFFEALGRGAASGATLGFDNEAIGLVDEEAAAKYKARSEQSRKERPVVDFLGNVIGGVAAPIVATALLPEAAALAGAGLLAKGASLVPKAIQASRAARLAGRVAGSGLIGGGYGAAAGAGGAEEGKRLEGAKEGFLPGVAFGGAGQFLAEGAGAAYRGAKTAIEPLRAKLSAQRTINEQIPGGIVADTVGDAIPGYRPMVADDQGIALAKEIDPKAVEARIAENEAAIKAAQRPGGDENISTPFVSGTTAFDKSQADALAANEARQSAYKSSLETEAKRVADEKSSILQQAETEKTRLVSQEDTAKRAVEGAASKVPTYLGSDPNNLRKATAVYNKAEASKKVRGVADSLEESHDAKVLADWKVSAPEKAAFNASGDWKRKINLSVPSTDSDPIKKFVFRINELTEKTNLAEVQNITSDLKAFARDAQKRGDYNDSRIARNLDKNIFETIKNDPSVLSRKDFSKWQKNIDASTEYYKKWDNYVTGKYLADESLTADAATTLDNFLTGRANETKSKQLLSVVTDQKGRVDKAALKDIENYLSHDLIEKSGDDLVSKQGLGEWQAKYANVFKTFPGLREKFGSFEKAIKTAADAAEEAKKEIKVKELEGIAKSIKASEIPEPGKILPSIQERYKYLPTDPTDPIAIKSSMEKVLREDDPKSMQTFLDVVGRTDESLNGTKRLLGEMIFESKNPYDFLSNPKNKAKLKEVFSSKDEQAYLTNIEKAFETISKQKTIGASKSKEKSMLDSTLRTASIAATKPATGYFGAVTVAKILNNVSNIPKDRRNAIIIEGLLDPKGLGKDLSKPMPLSDLNGWRKAYSRMLPGIIAGETRINEPSKEQPTQPIPRININTSPKYAVGGPVYTHPAISSIRAKRAMRSFAR
jgi:hypothetical protein